VVAVLVTSDKITSAYIKAALLHYFRFKRRYIPATEVTYGSIADILAYNDSEVVEVEVKISKANLYREAKEKVRKHAYLKTITHPVKQPNRFYFCVPEVLVEDTIKFANELNDKYGVMSYSSKCKWLEDRISVKKVAKSLHTTYSEILKKYIIKRITSELCRFYRKKLENT